VYVLAERPGIKDMLLISRLSEMIDAALCHQLVASYPPPAQHAESYPPPASVAELRASIWERLATAQQLSTRHSELLAAFKSTHGDVEFPALHRELFSLEAIDTDTQQTC